MSDAECPDPGKTLRNILKYGCTAGQTVDHTGKHSAHSQRCDERKHVEFRNDPAIDPADDQTDQDRADKAKRQRNPGNSHQSTYHAAKTCHTADGKIEFVDAHNQGGTNRDDNHQ